MIKKYASIIIFLFVIGAIIVWFFRTKVSPNIAFQNLNLINVATNEKLNTNTLKGNVVLLSFFQTWCVDCIKETEDLVTLSSTLKNKNLKILYVSDEPLEKIIAFKNRFGNDSIIYTQSSKTLDDIGIHVYPTTYLLNKKAAVIKSSLQAYTWSNDKELIQKLLNE